MHPTADAVSALNAEQLAEAYKSSIQWDQEDKSAWFFFYRDQLREWVFFTDQRTFKERYELAQQNGLEGFCSWVLGDEDPAIWQVLPQRH
jgi:spore germination protein YaaH